MDLSVSPDDSVKSTSIKKSSPPAHQVKRRTLRMFETNLKRGRRWMGEGGGESFVGWTRSNLNAAEVSMTQQPVCGYHTDPGPQRFLLLPLKEREREAAPFMVPDSQKTCSNPSINTPPFLLPGPTLTSDMSRFSGPGRIVRAGWPCCFMLYPPPWHLMHQLGGGGGVIPGC